MVTVTVRPLGPWQMMLGGNTIRIEVKGNTVRDLIKALDSIAARRISKETLTKEGDLDPRFRIYVNGVSCDDHGLNTRINNGDTIMLFSVIDGG